MGRAAPPAVERSAERTSERPAVRAAPCSRPRRTPGSWATAAATRCTPTRSTPPPSPLPWPRRPRTATTGPGAFPLWLPAVAVLVVLAMVVGIWMLTRDGDGGGAAADQPGSDTPSAGQPTESDSPADEDPTSPAAPAGNPTDLAGGSTATGPKPLAPGQDLGGNPVAYPPANMLDEDLATAYRIPGDASGETVVFTLPEEAEISEVGLVNGYAKKDSGGSRTVDWYALNRRILKVEWVFDDGTTVAQDLRAEPVLQTIAVDKVRTSTISLRILEVSAPGRRRAEQERDRDQRRPAPRRPLTRPIIRPTFAVVGGGVTPTRSRVPRTQTDSPVIRVSGHRASTSNQIDRSPRHEPVPAMRRSDDRRAALLRLLRRHARTAGPAARRLG